MSFANTVRGWFPNASKNAEQVWVTNVKPFIDNKAKPFLNKSWLVFNTTRAYIAQGLSPDTIRSYRTQPATIKIHEQIRHGYLKAEGDDGKPVSGAKGVQDVSTEKLFGGKRVVIFAVPGSFTETCSKVHFPTIAGNAQEIQNAGVDAVYCIAGNNIQSLIGWKASFISGSKPGDESKITKVGVEQIMMLSDPTGDFLWKNGLLLNRPDLGPVVAQRAAVVIERDGTVSYVGVENDPKACTVSSGVKLLNFVKESVKEEDATDSIEKSLVKAGRRYNAVLIKAATWLGATFVAWRTFRSFF